MPHYECPIIYLPYTPSTQIGVVIEIMRALLEVRC